MTTKTLFSILAAIVMLSAMKAGAQDLVSQYNTYISGNDIENSDGKRLTSVPEILRQDRANVYRFDNPDGDPTGDGGDFFKSNARRELISGMYQNGPGVEGKLKKAILRGDAFITVSIYRTGSGRYFIEVDSNNA